MGKVLHEYRDKNGDLVRVRESSSGQVYIDAYKGDERDKDNHERETIKISSGDGKPTGHGNDHTPIKYGK